MKEHFSQTVVFDFEYEVAVGGLPNVLCMVAYVLDEHLRHVSTIHLWRGVVGQPLPPINLYRGEFGRVPPFDIGPDTLFVAYSAWAEMTCFQMLGWRFPVHVFDQHTAYLAASNILLPYNPDEKRIRQSKGLSDACRAYGIEGWERIDKKGISADIGNGLWQKYGKEAVLDYCEEDVKASTQLLRAQLRDRCDYRGHVSLPAADVERVLHWSNYSAKSIAPIQARGMPIDVPLWNTVQENKQAVIADLLRRFDPSHGDEETIYTPDGEWSYARFERFLVRHGVYAWPRLDSGQLDISGDAFRLMYPFQELKICTHYAIASASSARRAYLSDLMDAIALRCFRLAPLPGAMLTARAHTTRMLRCGPSCCFHPAASALTSTIARKKLALLPYGLVTKP